MVSLTSMYFQGNQLDGTIPGYIGMLSNLEEMDLNGNSLSGTIPNQIGMLVNIHKISLQGNFLTGTIPTNVVSLSNLNDLLLGDNELEGSVPEDLYSSNTIISLDVARNQLSGTLPSLLNSCNFASINLMHNHFFGTIPGNMLSLHSLTYLSLKNNQLNGTIPVATSDILNYLDLSENFLHGSIPESIGNLNGLTALDLSLNSLSGSIPSTLTSLLNLKTLYLKENNLNGVIPNSIGDLSELTTLDLSHNNLQGTIPQSLASLTTLTSFALNDNWEICDGCFRFLFEISYCNVSGISQSCSCGFIPCGPSICEQDISCFDCGANYSSIGYCSNGILLIDSSVLNSKEEFLLLNVNSIINGDVSIKTLNFVSSSITINGNVIGASSFLNLTATTLIVNGQIQLYGTTIHFGIDSRIIVYDLVQIQNSTFIVDLSNSNQPRTLITFLSINSTKIDLNSIQLKLTNNDQSCPYQLQSQYLFSTANLLVVKSCSKSGDPQSSPTLPVGLIAGLTGGIFGVVVLIGVGICIARAFRQKINMKKLLVTEETQ
eukprot:TRINITY_DN2925_c0_g1_i1.p1 TRINITY_DN2925_c0_g1~~TRINITY_DN2925_c0_g1_i1.p1  ORF type:complete len:546 (-),score=104.12 TRINITY_DN2925_c0_g1_i1:21-1658(-)